MSLLKRIESARPGSADGAPAGGAPVSNVPAPAGGPPQMAAGARAPPPAPARGGRPPQMPAAPRLQTQAPVRESFRDVKFRIQNRVIQDLDPKLDLSNQVEVRRQIEE